MMPADGIPRRHRLERSVGAPVSKGSFKEGYRMILRSTKGPSYWSECRTNNSVATNGSDVRLGSKRE
jgi:hypothetical protein